MPSPTEIAAYIGAGAWIPILMVWAYRCWIRPFVTVTPQNFVLVGYTTWGPILNLNLAITIEKKDAMLEQFGAKITHENGGVHDFTWSGMSETFSQIRDATGTQQVVEKEHLAIALQLSTYMLTERFVRFQDPTYHVATLVGTGDLMAHDVYLRANNRINKLMDSQQWHDLIQAMTNHFWWIPGRYEIEFHFHSPHRAKLRNRKFTFLLTQLDVDRLRSNLNLIEEDMEDNCKGGQEGYEPHKVQWQWITSALNPNS